MTIHRPSPTRLLIGASWLGVTLALVGCADDDSAAVDRDTTTPVSDQREATETPDPEPLPMTDHVVAADGLPGFAGQGSPQPQDLKAFAQAHEKGVNELRRSGFRSGATMLFDGDGQQGFALSVAVEYADPAAAEAEAERLFASNTEGDPSIRTRPLELPGVAGARAASLHGSDGGMRLTGVEIVFVDGAVMHEVFAVGEATAFDLDGVVAAVTSLHERVAGHPVA